MKSWMFLTVWIGLLVLAGCGGDDSTGTGPNGTNQAPAVPSNQTPTDGASGQNLDVTLSWQCSDPDRDPLVYDVYFGTGAIPSLVSANITLTNYDPGQLQGGTTYFWKVIAKDNTGHSTSGSVWSFSTIEQQVGLTVVGHHNGHATNVFVLPPMAYVLGSGLTILDISDPAKLFLRGSFSGSGTISSIYVLKYSARRYAFTGGTDRAIVVDVTDPTQPQDKDQFREAEYGMDITYDGNRVFVADGYNGLQIYHSPTNPALMDTYGLRNSCRAVNIQSGRAYIIAGLNLEIIDLTVSPVRRLGSYEAPGAFDVMAVGDYAYVANKSKGLYIIDVSTPQIPTFAGAYVTASDAIGVYVDGNYAFVATGTAGLSMIDITNPTQPTEVARYDSPGFARNVFVLGGYAYLADSDSGLYVLQITR